MALDAQAEAILKGMADSGFELSEKTTPQEMRDLMSASSGMRQAEEVGDVREMSFAGPAGDVKVRVYWPKGHSAPADGSATENDSATENGSDPAGGGSAPSENLPAVVFFHGGGWVIGGLDSHDGQVREMTNRTEAIYVSVDYRLAPENPYPAAADDSYAALCWVAENGADLGIDTSRLAVAGDSAGGNLAAVVSQMARDKNGPALKFQLLVYPCTDMDTEVYSSMQENADGPFLTCALMDWFHNHYAQNGDRNDPYMSPIRASDLSGLPPALVLTAELDPLRDEGEAYAEKMAAAGVNARFIRCAGMFHGFFAFTEFIDKAAEAQSLSAEALKEALFS